MTSHPTDTETRSFEPLDWGLLATAAGIWGSSFLLMDIALDHFEPGLVTWLRVLFGASVLWSLPASHRPIHAVDRPTVALLGFVWMALPFTMFPIAQQWIDSSLTGMLNSAMPLATLIIGMAMFGSTLIRRQVTGVLVGVVGILFVGVPTAQTGDTSALGVGLILVAMTSYGVAANINTPLTQKYGSLPLLRNALGWAALFTAPLGLIDLADSSFDWGALIACAVLGAGGTGLAYIAASTLGGRVGALRMSVLTYLIPIVAAALGVIFRDETIGGWAIAGTLIVLLGAWVATRATGR